MYLLLFFLSYSIGITIHQGMILSTKAEEIHCINPDYLAQYGFLLRPKNTQFVWNQQILPIQLNSSGHYILSDMENSQTTLQYEYQNKDDQAVLVLYSKYWIINRTNDILLYIISIFIDFIVLVVRKIQHK